MGFLDGLLSPGLTAVSQAVAGKQQGDIQGFLEKRKLDQAEAAASLKAALEGAQMRNLNSEIFTREHPKPTYDSDRGVTVDVGSGTSTPVAGLEPKPHAPVLGTPEYNAAKAAEADIQREHGYHPPQSQFSFGTAVGADGNPVVLRQNTKTGDITPTDVVKPKPGGNQASAAQQGAMKANMESAMKTMDAYEAKLKADPSLFGAIDATEGALASSPAAITAQHAWDIPLSMAANQSASRLQKTNPELMRYLTAKKFMAEAILNTHKRPNQTQYEIEQEIGGVGPNPTPMQIDMVASRRARMYQELFGGQQTPPPSQAPSHTGASDPGGDIHLGKSSKPSLNQAEYDAGIARGHSDAEIASHYDLSGVRRQK